MKILVPFLLIFLVFSANAQTKRATPKPPAAIPAVTKPEPFQKVGITLVSGEEISGLFVSGDSESVSIKVASNNLVFKFSEIQSLRMGEAVESKTQNTTITEAPKATSLAFEAALVYTSGGAQPVARTDFVLLNKSLQDVLQDAGLRPEANISLIDTFAFAMQYAGTNRNYQSFLAVAVPALKNSIVSSTSSDFSGKGVFENITPGKYWIMSLAKTRRGYAIWNLPVEVKEGSNGIILDQRNAATAL